MGSGNELLLFHLKDASAHQPCITCPPKDDHRCHDLSKASAPYGGDHDGCNEKREAHKDVGYAHHDLIKPTADISRNRSHNDPYEACSCSHGYTDSKRSPSAPNEAIQDIVLLVVSPNGYSGDGGDGAAPSMLDSIRSSCISQGRSATVRISQQNKTNRRTNPSRDTGLRSVAEYHSHSPYSNLTRGSITAYRISTTRLPNTMSNPKNSVVPRTSV